MSLPAPVIRLADSAELDACAVAAGLELGDLMQRAGRAVARELARLYPEGPILVACGGGNNGGDGYVAALALRDSGRQVSIWQVLPPKSELCKQAAAAAASLPRVTDPSAAPAAVICDAILGAGVYGDLRPPLPQALAQLAGLGRPIVSIDAPSGIGTPQALLGAQTICIQVAKHEVLAQSGAPQPIVVDIGIPSCCLQEVSGQCLRHFPLLQRDHHKGKHGQILIVGGGRYPGALQLACQAALATGCDLVHAWTSEGPPLPPSIIEHRQPGPTMAPSDPDAVTAMLLRADAVLIGPGLGRQAGAPEAAQQAFDLALDMGVPTVVDADGITALATQIRALPTSDVPVVVTPHRREAALLLGKHIDDAGVHAFARPDRVMLRKGSVDLVTDGNRWQENHFGNPRMTVGGTGDLLAGLCAGLIARRAEPYHAARMAVFWLTTAADGLWQERGPCYTPEDLLAALPATLKYHLQRLDRWPPMAP